MHKSFIYIIFLWIAALCVPAARAEGDPSAQHARNAQDSQRAKADRGRDDGHDDGQDDGRAAGPRHVQPGVPLAAAPFAPIFFDPGRLLPKPDLAGLTVIRFLTDDENPPFHFTTADGALTGFDVDLARALCEELKIACTIQARRWETLIDALTRDQGDAVMAAMTIAPHPQVAFSAPYWTAPARFVARRATPPAAVAPTPEALQGVKVGVVAASAHAAWLTAFFPQTEARAYETVERMRAALAAGDVDLAFGDATAFAIWLNGASSADCCVFFGGPFLNKTYFGAGAGVAVAKDNAPLRRAIDYALAEVSRRGVFSELYLKYFPIEPF